MHIKITFFFPTTAHFSMGPAGTLEDKENSFVQ